MIQLGNKKFSVIGYISILFIITTIIVVLFIMFKYSVEGESKPPFTISKIIVTSSAKTTGFKKSEDLYEADVLQNNDIKIAIQKNPEYKKEAKIKKITINNVKITETDNADKIKIYRPSTGTNLYEYIEEYDTNGNLEYIGSTETDIKSEDLKISNQGGILELSVTQNALGKLEYKENEQIKIDGTLLGIIGLKKENISFNLTFDMILELENGTKFKTVISMELPKGNIIENGVEIYEHTDFKTVFKRI